MPTNLWANLQICRHQITFFKTNLPTSDFTGEKTQAFNNRCRFHLVITTFYPQCSEDQWDKIFDINVKAAFLLAQMAAPEMMKNENGGAIVFNSSIAGLLPMPVSKTFDQKYRPMSVSQNDLPGRIHLLYGLGSSHLSQPYNVFSFRCSVPTP